jgi:hypothetical protein
MNIASGCNNFTADTGTQIPIPPGAVPGGSSDHIITVYSPSLNKVWEFWLASNNGGSWSACWGGEATLSTFNGVFPNPYGETASGISNLATEITEADIASGSINHAIEFEVLGNQCDGSIPPADRSDCGSNVANAPSEGSYFRFAPGTAMPGGLSPFAQMVFRAVSTYGIVVSDQGGDPSLEADNVGPAINASLNGLPAYQVLANLPWNSLQAIAPPG